MESSLFGVGENTSCLSDVVGASLSPRDLRGVSLLEDVDLVSVDLDTTVDLLNSSLEAS